MTGLVTLTCSSCGARLQITDGIERFACAYCGTEHMVNLTGRTVSIQPIVDGLEKVQAGTGRTASELAIVRFKAEIGELKAQAKKIPRVDHDQPVLVRQRVTHITP